MSSCPPVPLPLSPVPLPIAPLPPVPLQEHLRGEALKTNELLRHFWPCMPPLSAHRVELAAKLAAALQKQHAHLTAFMRQDQGAAAGWI